MGGCPVLIVDDNPVNLKLVNAVLAPEGYDIRTAGDGAEAVRVVAEFRPRLILMDVQLPGIDGFEVTRRLKSNPETRDIVVVACTAYAMPGDEEKRSAQVAAATSPNRSIRALFRQLSNCTWELAGRRSRPSNPATITIFWRKCGRISW